jgi:hypothetical protein
LSPIAEASIDIDAPIEIVWRVMLDFKRYGEWNPFIVRADAADEPLRMGSRVRLEVRFASGRSATSGQTVTRLELPGGGTGVAERRAALAWRFGGWLSSARLVRAERSQTLAQPGDGSGPTRYHSREEFHGLLRAVLPLADVRDGFERQARALKARAESLARGDGQAG